MPIPDRSTIKIDLLQLIEAKGSITPADAYAELARKWRLTSGDKARIRSGNLLYQHEIRWARQELVIARVLARPHQSGRAIWKLQGEFFRHANEFPNEIPDKPSYIEGTSKKVLVNRFERDASARNECLRVHGFSCKACGVNFETLYGTIGKNCIHVHHLIPLRSIGRRYRVSPEKDLIPVCPNCHYMIHRREPPFSVSEIQLLLKNSSASHNGKDT